MLGAEYLNAFGVGFELDSSTHPVWVTRTRLMLRYYFSPYTHGTSIGVAVSF